jgi:hypothetical protein
MELDPAWNFAAQQIGMNARDARSQGTYSLPVTVGNLNPELREVGGDVYKSSDEHHNGAHLFTALPRVGGTP